MIKKEDVFSVGRIGKPHGVRGEVTFSFTDDVWDEVDADYLFLEVDGILVPFFLEEYRFRGPQTAIVKFCDVDTAEAARELMSSEVFFPKSLAPEDHTPTLDQWAGFKVCDAAAPEKPVGTVLSIDDTTVNTLLTVETTDGRQVLIPLALPLVDKVDEKTGTIVMHIPEGLLDL